MNPDSKLRKVLCPIETKNGKTRWLRAGAAFENRDGSTNVYLDLLPPNGRLQIREFDEGDSKKPPTGTTEPLPF